MQKGEGYLENEKRGGYTSLNPHSPYYVLG